MTCSSILGTTCAANSSTKLAFNENIGSLKEGKVKSQSISGVIWEAEDCIGSGTFGTMDALEVISTVWITNWGKVVWISISCSVESSFGEECVSSVVISMVVVGSVTSLQTIWWLLNSRLLLSFLFLSGLGLIFSVIYSNVLPSFWALFLILDCLINCLRGICLYCRSRDWNK